MTKITRFLPLVCVLLISGWFAPAASASPQTALSLNDRLASSPSGTVGLLSLAAPAAPYTETDTYYEGAEGKTGESLKSALHDIISGHTMLSYSEVWNALKETDEDPRNPNNVILLYTNESRSKNLNGGNVGDWNREHVWAKSHGNFGTSKGPGTDIHHLRPADVQVNSARGNMDFDNGGTEHAKAPGNYYDGDSWEPRDDVKGDVARMLFYMAVRYEGDDGYPDLELNDKTGNGSAPYHGKQSVLLEWNRQDPVDDRERKRNEIIYEKYSTTAILLSTTLNGLDEIWP